MKEWKSSIDQLLLELSNHEKTAWRGTGLHITMFLKQRLKATV